MSDDAKSVASAAVVYEAGAGGRVYPPQSVNDFVVITRSPIKVIVKRIVNGFEVMWRDAGDESYTHIESYESFPVAVQQAVEWLKETGWWA